MAGTGMAGWIDLHYTDGSMHREYVKSGKQLQNWWNPVDGKYSRVTGWAYKKAWSYNNGRSEVGVYQWGLNNPHPERTIKKIEFQHALNSSKWFVLGVTLSDQPAFFAWPKSTGKHLVNWNAGAVMRAYLEGLAGIKDEGTSFKNVTIGPRWTSANVKESMVTVKYPASDEYIKYIYKSNEDAMEITFTGSANVTELKVLLTKGKQVKQAFLDGNELMSVATEEVEDSEYVVLTVDEPGVHHFKLIL
jgi:hypothetical protein